jgi:hypothetical protein
MGVNLDSLGAYSGYIVGFAVLAAVLLLNQLIYRCRWKSYGHVRQGGVISWVVIGSPVRLP